MRESGQAYQLCPCYKECKEFHKLWELKDSGLMVYCHKRFTVDVQGECATDTSQDVFILDNEKNVEITPSQLNTEPEKKNISCLRCREIFRHAQELLKKVKSIDRKTVMGICDHCRKSPKTSKKPFCICDEMVKRYISVKDTQKENIKTNVKTWLSKLGHILKDETTYDKPKQIKTTSYSDIQINLSLKSPPASKHEPEIKQMFSGSQKSDINLEISGTDLKGVTQTVTFAQPIELMEKSFIHTTHEGEHIKTTTPATTMTDSDTTIVETHEGVKDLLRPSLKVPKQEIPSMDAKEALKKRHDLSLRHMMGFQKYSDVPYVVTERPDIYKIPKSAPWEQKEPTSEYHVKPEMVKKVPIPTKPTHDLRLRGTSDPDYVPVKPETHVSSRTSEKDVQDRYFQVKKMKEFYTADETKLQRSVTKFGHKTKKTHGTKSEIIPVQTAGRVLEPEFSFLFPKDKKKEEEPIVFDVSSSHLILETQEKFQLQAEREKQRQEEERQQKIKQDQEKKLAREQKKLQTEEEKILEAEFKKFAEEQKILTVEKKYSEKDLDTMPASKEEKQDTLKDDTSGKQRKLISEHELKDELSEIYGETKKGQSTSRMDLQKAKKDLKSKTEKIDKTDEDLQKSKTGFKSKPELKDKTDEDLQKSKTGFKSKPELKDKTDEDLQKSKKDLKSKSEQKDKTDADLQKSKKDLKSKSEQKDKTDEDLQKAKKDLKSKPEQKDKTDEDLQKSKKDLKSKSEQKDKTDADLQKSKKDLKSKSEQKDKTDEDLQKAKKDLKSKPEQKDKTDEDLQKAKKDLKSKSEQKGKTDADLQKPKTDVKSKPEQKDKTSKEKSEPKDKGGVKVTEKGKEDINDKPEQKTKALKSPQETPKSKGKDEEKEKDREDLKSPTKQKTKMAKDQQDEKQVKEKEIQEKLEKDKAQNLKEEKDKELAEQEKLQKEKEIKETNLQLKKEHEERMKQADQLRKEKEALKQQAIKDKIKDKENVSKEKDAPLKKGGKSKGKKTDEIKVSMTDIQKGMKKDKSEIHEKKQDKTVTEPKKKTSKLQLPKVDKGVEEFKKMQAEHLKEREVRLKLKRQQEYEAQLEKAKEKVKQLELNMRDIKIQEEEDDAYLKLVKIKQTAKMQADVNPKIIHDHKSTHRYVPESERCPLCHDSELELELLSLENKMDLQTPATKDVIIGEHIIKNRRRRLEKPKDQEHFPSVYRRHHFGHHESPLKKDLKEEIIQQEPVSAQKTREAFLVAKKDDPGVEVESTRGILRYALSDRAFIDKGWTMLPTEKVVRKMNVYRMRPAHPEFDWFEHNKKKRFMTYDTGEKLAEFDDNGRARLYYKNGRLALDYYNAEETNAQQRIVTYSSGEPDERGRTHPITILATFDYLGNGIVFDHAGKLRLKYNQTEGVVLDRGIGPVSHWKWHTLNDPPVLQQVMIDTQMAHKDPHIFKLGSLTERPGRPDNEEMLAIEFDNFIKEKGKKLSQKFKPFQIKMKALKINEHFSLKVLDQASVYLIFRDGSTNVKLNIGMVLDHQEIVDTDTAEVGEVSNSMERFPARTDSLAGLQRSVAYAQRYERQYTERERRLRPPEPCASADQLTAAASRPMRPPFRTMPPGGTSSSTSNGYCSRKPSNNLYYNTRLI